MTLKDLTNGPDWMIWLMFAVFAVLTVVFLTGHGGSLIAGYNKSSKKEKSKYDEKKLCRVFGIGMLVITNSILIMALGNAVLPANTAFAFLGVIMIDVAIMIILGNTYARRR